MALHQVIDNDDTGETDRDEEGLQTDQLIRWANEIRMQPMWRADSDTCDDYYAGNQLTPVLAGELQDIGLGPLITNLIAPTVNSVLGMEAKTRSDWRVIADSDDFQDVAEAQSARLFEAERESRADRACSDAYAGQIIAGLGWVEVGRNSDPFKYPYRVRAIHRREMHWDWRAKEHDLSDAKYVIRTRWFDIDEACAFFPEQADLIRGAGAGWPAEWVERAKEDVSLQRGFDDERRIAFSDWEWRNINARTVAIAEVWYRVFKRGLILDLGDRKVEFDINNPLHVAAVANGQVWPRAAVYSKLRRAFFVGPHRLSDDDMGTSQLPYIPFWGYREALTGVPYGLVRAMIGPQDEVNARRRKLLWQLSSKRVVVDSDALDTKYNSFRDMAEEVSRPDAIVITNPNRRNAQAFTVDSNLGLSEQQFKIMEESKQSIQEVAGVFNAMLGRGDQANSGLAINSLVEQGTTGLAEINDNYRYARRLVGERLLTLINEDLRGKPVAVVTGEYGTKRKTIVLNQPVVDPETGLTYLVNDISKAPTKVALEDVPSTPAYRAQMQTMMAEIIKALPPQMQAIMAPFFIETTELKNRHEIAALLKKQLGLDTGDGEAVDPQVAMLQQQLQELQQMMQQGGVQLEQAQREVATLTQQLKDRQAELELKRDQAKADVLMRGRELEIRDKELGLQAQKLTADTFHKQADRQAALLAEPERDEKAEAENIKRLVTEAVKACMPEPEKSDEKAEAARIKVAVEEALAKHLPETDEKAELERIRQVVESSVRACMPAPEKEEKDDVDVQAAITAAMAPLQRQLEQLTAAKATPKSITLVKDAAGNITGAKVEGGA